ncbi:phosphohistidine phosphatase SixA [Gammaproteobacteria bacterium]|nr:phosphohistidine phosphatase SixA [Gammaproteobacteria bacterium]
MKLLLMRHGEAEPNAQIDSDRPLTLYGREQVSAVARRLSEMDLQVEGSMVSPYLRARQTAAIMSGTIPGSWPEQISDAITPDQPAEGAALAIARCFDTAFTGLVVTHQPIISRLVYYLTGQDEAMGTANLAIIEAPQIALGCCELECVI